MGKVIEFKVAPGVIRLDTASPNEANTGKEIRIDTSKSDAENIAKNLKSLFSDEEIAAIKKSLEEDDDED